MAPGTAYFVTRNLRSPLEKLHHGSNCRPISTKKAISYVSRDHDLPLFAHQSRSWDSCIPFSLSMLKILDFINVTKSVRS